MNRPQLPSHHRPHQFAIPQPRSLPLTLPRGPIQSDNDSDDSYYDDLLLQNSSNSQPSDTSQDFYEQEKGKLTVSELATLPLRRYQKTVIAQSCAICLCEFVDKQMLSCLPCMHSFHTDCIGKWLITKNDCPLCKSKV